MNLLVTGGAGYIGSAVASSLVRTGHTVVVYDNLTKGNPRAVPEAAKLVVGDIDDRTRLQHTFERFDFDGVLHFAAFIEAGESMENPGRYFRNNTSNTLTLLEVMIEQGVHRLVFSSTAALYGEPQRVPIAEEEPLEPTNAYGESKLLVERMLGWFHRIHGLSYASLRYFNAAGACHGLGEDHKPESHLIPIVLQAALGQRGSVSIYGTDYPTDDGTCVRDYIHVSDLAAAHLLALDALKGADKPTRLIYNLGNGRGFSVREVIAAARRVTGRTIPAIEQPRRPGDPAVLVASSEKIKRELLWRPEYTDIDMIIRSAWTWRVNHPDGYADSDFSASQPHGRAMLRVS